MTENKRFVIFQDNYDDLHIQDKEVYRATGIKVGNEEDVKYENVSKIVELLNELAEENEQLKTRNDNQAKQLDNLYQLIEQKDWRALTKIIDDFKQSDEQLQKEWGTYGDVE